LQEQYPGCKKAQYTACCIRSGAEHGMNK